MPIEYFRGEGEVKALAAQAGKAQAQREQNTIKLQQAFQKEMAMLEFSNALKKQQMAMDWENQKMLIASQLDFEQSEKKRIREQELFDSGLEQIKKKEAEGVYPPETIDRAYQEWAAKHPDAAGAAPYLGIDKEIAAQNLAYEKLLTEIQNNPLIKDRPELANVVQFMKASRDAGVPISDRSLIAPMTSEKPQTAVDYLAELEALAKIPGYQQALESRGITVPSFQSQKIGDIIQKNGRTWKVVGFDTDGTALVEPQ